MESAPTLALLPDGNGSNPVVLSAALHGNEVILSWPTNAVGFSLESTPRLPAATWAPSPLKPVVVNDRYTVTYPASENSEFFRLKKP